MSKILSFVAILCSIQGIISQNLFQKYFNNEEWSSKRSMRIDFKDSAGNEGFLPISILKGKSDGPVFTIIAGVHGYEYPPIVATQGILKEVDVEQLKGTCSWG